MEEVQDVEEDSEEEMDDGEIIGYIDELIHEKDIKDRGDKKFQEKIITLLDQVTDVEKADEEIENYIKGNIETGLLATLVQSNMVDVIKYLVNRDDVSRSYVNNGFIWACRRVDQVAIFAILDSGKVTRYGLQKGIRELKIEGSDKKFIEKLAKAITLKIMENLKKNKLNLKEEEEEKKEGKKLKSNANYSINIKSIATDTINGDDIIIGDYITKNITSPSDTIIIIKVLDRLDNEQYFVYTTDAYKYFTNPSGSLGDIDRSAPAVVFPCVKSNGLYLYTSRGSLTSAPKRLVNMQLDKPLLSLDVLFKMPGHVHLGDINKIISKQVASKYNVIGILVSRDTNNNVPSIAKYPFDTGVSSLHCNPGGESVQIWGVHEISNIDEINRQVKKSIEKEGGNSDSSPFKTSHERKIDKTRKKIKQLVNAETFRVKKSTLTHKRIIRIKKTSKKKIHKRKITRRTHHRRK